MLVPSLHLHINGSTEIKRRLEVCFTNQFGKDHTHDTNFYEHACHNDNIDPAMLKIRKRNLEFPETSSNMFLIQIQIYKTQKNYNLKGDYPFSISLKVYMVKFK